MCQQLLSGSCIFIAFLKAYIILYEGLKAPVHINASPYKEQRKHVITLKTCEWAVAPPVRCGASREGAAGEEEELWSLGLPRLASQLAIEAEARLRAL